MLFTELSTGFAIFTALFTIFAVFLFVWQVKLANFCRDAVVTVLNQNKRAVSLRRMAEVEATLTELLDSYESLMTSHKKLRSRISMRHIREKRQNGEDIPDSRTDPDGYKAKMRIKLRQDGLLK